MNSLLHESIWKSTIDINVFQTVKTKLYSENTKTTTKITTQRRNSSVLGKLLSLCILCEKRSIFHKTTLCS